MAKKVKKVINATSNKCTCNFAYLLLAMLLLALGLFLIVSGFRSQYEVGEASLKVIGWYFFGFLSMTLGCYTKHRHLGCCPEHGWNK